MKIFSPIENIWWSTQLLSPVVRDALKTSGSLYYFWYKVSS